MRDEGEGSAASVNENCNGEQSEIKEAISEGSGGPRGEGKAINAGYVSIKVP